VTASPEAENGSALLERGRLAAARVQFWADADAAEARGDGDALGRAALGLGGVWVHEHRSRLERARVLGLQRRALASLAPDSPLAHRLRTRLTAEDAYLVQQPEGPLGELESARRRGDPLQVAEALSLAHHCVLGPDHGALRLALADELIAVSAATGRAFDGLAGLMWRTVDLFLSGDRHAERSLRELRERLATDPCDCFAFIVAGLDVTRAVRAGRLDDAERAAEACYHLGVEVGDADACGYFGAQLTAIRWFQGRGQELLPVVEDLAHSTTLATPNDAFFAALAVLAVSAGRPDTARSALAGLRAGGLGAVPRSSNWLATLLGVCEAAHALGDAEAAREAYDLLTPFARLPVMVSLGIVCFGSAHRPLGLAARTVGDLDLAVTHLEAAIAADLSIGHRPAHAMDCATLAEVLVQRARPDDERRAAALLDEAIAEAHRCGMAAHAARWSAGPARKAVGALVRCRREARSWKISVDDRTARVPHSVGMGYLATLIDRMGEAIPAIELASGHTWTLRGCRPEPVLDARATASYRRRIEELQQELEEAEEAGDPCRADRARHELEQYLEELARATGFAGASRPFDDEAERARLSVHKAIKRALERISAADRIVGDELRARVLTGIRCEFRVGAAA
jgi:hypothetical protein